MKERENSHRESSPASSNFSTNKYPDLPPQYPTQPPPQPMYYPNHHYPQYPNTYPPGYPSPGPGPGPGLGPSPGPGGYYYPHNAPYYGHPPPTYHTSSAGSRLYRSFIVCSCVILTFLFLTSLTIALVLRPQLPVYKVVSLSITNFSTTPTSLNGQWDAKLLAENPNEKLVGYFADFRVNMVYKDGVVAVTRAPSFVLNTHGKLELNVTSFSNHVDGYLLEQATLDDLVKERGTGSVTFSLRLSSLNIFKSGSFSTRSEEIVGLCDGLKVKFQDNNSTTGTFDSKGNPIECHIYI